MSTLIGGKFLTFSLGREEYGVSIGLVKEINGMMDITPVPGAPGYIKGVINLRGKIVPVMDLRLRFGLPEAEYTQRTCLIVFEVGEKAKRLFSIAVDSVSEVLNIQTAEMEQPARYSEQSEQYLLGLGKTRGKVVLLLDVARVTDVILIDGMEQVGGIV